MDYTAIGLVTQWVALGAFARLLYKFRGKLNPASIDWANPAHVIGFAIAYHFALDAIDSSWWHGVWYSAHLEHRLQPALTKIGVIQNIPFRHIGKIVIVYLHLKAVAMQEGKNVDLYWTQALIIGFLASAHVWSVAP